MYRSSNIKDLALLVILLGTPAVADPGPFARFRGGGPARTDCMLVTDVAGVAARPRAHATTCTDGDPTCDGDGISNGTCVLTVRLCLDDPTEPACTPEPVTHAAVTASLPALADLNGALGEMAMPVDTPETCTSAMPVPVATRGRRPGRLVLHAAATMGSGHADRDRLWLVCRPAGPPATFVAVARTVFATSCASTSCHGAAAAGGLALVGEGAYAQLVGVPPVNDAARAAGLLLVAPGDPARSFLLAKLTGALATGEGAQMPRVGPSLPADRVNLVRRWIAAGAPANVPF